mmetsp:Transcript_18588/g.54548  ORF Transcript_18588/g.54548 Transcript_18588/m.54548 type:complete len:204 (+) Transcript_18588:2-613(+)
MVVAGCGDWGCTVGAPPMVQPGGSVASAHASRPPRLLPGERERSEARAEARRETSSATRRSSQSAPSRVSAPHRVTALLADAAHARAFPTTTRQRWIASCSCNSHACSRSLSASTTGEADSAAKDSASTGAEPAAPAAMAAATTPPVPDGSSDCTDESSWRSSSATAPSPTHSTWDTENGNADEGGKSTASTRSPGWTRNVRT